LRTNCLPILKELTTEERFIGLTAKKTRRPDIICFVNGIPLVVIECKRPDKSSQGERAVWEGVSQMIRNQRF
jgi:type I restriction enzyme R subunit